MTTIHAKVSRTDCYLKVDGSLTSGMVGVPISFEFTPEWKELKKTAVFYAGTVKRDRINIERSTTVPAEVLQKSMENLYVGIYGYREDGTIVIPTVMAKVGMILRGANPSGDPGADPDLPIWADLERRVSDLEEGCGDAAVKSVNGISPDENGNVEIKIPESSGSSVTIDPTLTKSGQAADAKAVGDALAELEKKIPKQPADAELFDKADLPLDNQSFVTLDGVEYYRYNAGATNFEWVNPKPEKGAVTITARGVSQYGGTGTTRLKTVYNDGTFGPDIYIVVGGESRTASVTTDENKTLAKITGNYDLENWVLLDMSVMSVRADYLVQEECILPVATADNLGGIKADPVESTDTQPVRIGVDGKLYTTPGGGGDRWTKLGDVTVRGTYEIVPLSFTGGIVTVDTTTEAYSLMSQYNQANCVVHPIDIASKNTAPVVGLLRKLDVEAGTFEFLNRDGVLQSTAAYDPTIYKISLDNVTSVEMTDVPSYDLYKLRMTTPVLTSHGLRSFFISTMTCLSMNACAVIVASGGGIFEVETMRYPTDPNYMYKRSNVSYGVWYHGR